MPYSLAVKNKTREFIDLYGAGIINAIKGTNLFFATVVAQKCLESGYGASLLAKEDFNFGGIKYAPKLAGVIGYTVRDTAEYIGGKKVIVKQKFSKFKDAESGIRATIQVLLADRYKNARDNAKTAKEQVLMIARAGYTTTPAEKYLASLSGIIEATQDYVQIGRVTK
jgi:flagellum-specific peptidoglycan hydrolase FlgJ